MANGWPPPPFLSSRWPYSAPDGQCQISDFGFSTQPPTDDAVRGYQKGATTHRPPGSWDELPHPAPPLASPWQAIPDGVCGRRTILESSRESGTLHRDCEEALKIRNPKSEIRNSSFDWRIYADATCAGLSVLIPLPLVDSIFETVFRRRIPGTIARARRREVAPLVRRRLGRAVDGSLSLQGCFKLFFTAVRYVLRKIWRKIIYVFTIKDAATALSEYWHRAYLINHMVRAGHLEADVDTDLAVRVFERTLREADLSPLMGLARQTVANAHHVLGILARARRLGAAEVARSLGDVLASHWKGAEASLVGVGEDYNRHYRLELEARGAAEGLLDEAPDEVP